jgi:uncharacterized protein (TIGR03435 family)
MLQDLLKDRFGLVVHRETRELTFYVLTVLKSGLKLKPSPAVSPDAKASSAPSEITFGEDGLPILPPGRPEIVTMPFNGRLRVVARQTGIAELTETIRNQLRTPVSDETGLTGHYDFTFDFLPEEWGIPVDADLGQLSLESALKQLGLRLQRQKRPLSVIVVDHADKTPTDN